MKKIIAGILTLGLLGFIIPISTQAAGCSFPASYTDYGAGSTITSACLNAYEEIMGMGASTSTSLTSLIAALQVNNYPSSTYAKVANNLSDLLSTSTAVVNLGLGNLANALQLIRSNNLSDLSSTSSARLNIGLGNVSNALQLVAANNLSDLTNTSTARTNLGLGTAATLASSTWLKVANNLSDLTSTSSARTNIGYQAGSGITISGTGVIAATASNVAGAQTQVQYNDGGQFAATSTFTFTSSTETLAVPNISANVSTSALTINGISAPSAGFNWNATTTVFNTSNSGTSTMATATIQAMGGSDELVIQNWISVAGGGIGGTVNLYVSSTPMCAFGSLPNNIPYVETLTMKNLNSTSSQYYVCSVNNTTSVEFGTANINTSVPFNVSSTANGGGNSITSQNFSAYIIK